MEAQLSLGESGKILSVGMADFVQSGEPWEGQITAKAENYSRL